MRLSTIILLGLFISSCGQKIKETDATSPTFDLTKTNKAFEDQIKEHIDRWNKKNNDSVTTSIIRDSTFIFQVDNSELLVVLSQYQTSDKRKKIGIVSIENFGRETMPTYLISNDNADKYLGDSVIVTTDRLLIYGRILKKDGQENFRLSFDTNFDGKTFPWDIE
jgi:hypothetical protein